MYTSKIVKLFEHKELISGICVEEQGNCLRILLEDGSDVKIGASRVVHASSYSVCLKEPVEKLLKTLKQRAGLQQEMVKSIRAGELWELVEEKGRLFDFNTLAAIVFGDKADFDHEVAVILALMKDRVFFRLQGSGFFANTPEKVDMLKSSMEKERQKEQEIADGILWLRSIMEGKEATCCKREKYIELLKNYAVFGKEASDYSMTESIIKKAGPVGQKICFDVLVKLGIWDEDENLPLQKYRISNAWPEAVLEQVDGMKTKNIPESDNNNARADFTNLKTFSIDEASTRDIDDAISFEFHDDSLRLWIHVADAASFIPPCTPVDKEASRRGASLYLPDGKIPMIPQTVSEDLLSLSEGNKRPAVSIIVNLSLSGEILDYKGILSFVRVDEKLNYDEVNADIANGGDFSRLYNVARILRAKRIENDAVCILIPELQVIVDENKKIHLKKRDKESSSQVLVSECMILANYCASLLFKEKKLPALYRKQSPPANKIGTESNPSLYQLFTWRRHFSRVEVDVQHGPHSNLGLSSYTSITSPLRKYLDLVAQRQLVSLIKGDGPVYERKELKEICSAVQPCLTRAAVAERERKRYWALKALQKTIGKELKAIILDVRFSVCNILLVDYLIDAHVKAPEGISISPGDTVCVTIESVDPFEGILKVSLKNS